MSTTPSDRGLRRRFFRAIERLGDINESATNFVIRAVERMFMRWGVLGLALAFASMIVVGAGAAALQRGLLSGAGFLQSGTGAVLISGEAKLRQTVNVLDYGADSTGATSSTTAVNNAVAALPSSGGKLVFPAGTFKFNASAITKAIAIDCAGSGSVSTGNGGTKLIPNDASLPIFQFGNGAATTARGMSISHCLFLGDAANATGDAIYLYAARDVLIHDITCTSFGRNCVRIQCNTASSSGIHIAHSALATNNGPAFSAESCAGSFTSDLTITDSHLNAGSASGSHAIYLDSTDVRLIGTYVDTHDAVTGGGVKLVKSLSTNPVVRMSSSTLDNADGSAAITVDVSSYLAAANRMATAISGCGTVNGKIKYSDATVSVSVTRDCALLQPWLVNASTFNSLQFPIDEVEAQAGGSLPTLSRSGNTPDTDADLVLAHSGFKVSAAEGSNGFNNGLHLGTSALYKNQSNLLMFRKDSNRPAAENNAQPLNWVEVTPSTASTTVTIDLSQGNVFDATYTTNAVHTIANPSGSGTGVSSHGMSLMEICTINTSGAALGVFTWSANYRFVGGTAPATPAGTGGTCTATGCRSCIQFRQDAAGSPWRETWRGGDQPN